MATMITVKVGSNTSRTSVLVPSNTSLRKVLEDNNINYGTSQVHLDGVALPAGSLDKTFEEIGITTSCYLIAVVKTDNAFAA